MLSFKSEVEDKKKDLKKNYFADNPVCLDTIGNGAFFERFAKIKYVSKFLFFVQEMKRSCLQA